MILKQKRYLIAHSTHHFHLTLSFNSFVALLHLATTLVHPPLARPNRSRTDRLLKFCKRYFSNYLFNHPLKYVYLN